MGDPKSNGVYEEMRCSNVFCDAVLKVGQREFPVHKVILCGASNYFRAMFERWDHHHDGVFNIGGVSPSVMSLVLRYIYTGSTALPRDKVQDLAQAADMLLLDDLVKVCFTYMEHHMCPENCIGIWKFTDLLFSPTTRILAWRHILNHFTTVTANTEFLELLTSQELMSIIETDELMVKKESVVFEAIENWTRRDLEARRAMFPQLLTKVRLSLMSISSIRGKVLQSELVESSPDCVRIVSRSMMAAHRANIDRMYSDPTVRPRLPEAILLAIGGWSNGDPTNTLEAYDYKVNCWIDVTVHQERPRAYHGSVFFNGSVYCVGGFDGTEYCNSMRRLDLSTKCWHEMPPMYHRRCYVSVTLLHNCIYAIGGHNGQVRLRSAEVYDTTTNQWSLIANMTETRSDANCATLNNKIYICGGFNGNECLETAECYCPETNQWTTIAPMSTRRSGVAVTAYANQIFAVGGFDGASRLRSIEAYNPRTNRWEEMAQMHTPRSNFGIEVVDDRIFVVGGYIGEGTTDEVESYDPQLNTWTQVCDMDLFRSALRCCVVFGLPNMSEYTVDRDFLPLLSETEESVEEEPT